MRHDEGQETHSGADARPSRLPGPWLAVIFVIVAFLVATVVGQVLLSIYPAAKHWDAAQTQEWLANSLWAQFSYICLAYGMLFGLIVLFLKRRGLGLASIGFKRPRLRDAGWALALLPLYYGSYIVIVEVAALLIPSLDVNQKQQIGFEGIHGFVPLLITFISLAVIPPIVEETVMRGFLFTSLRSRLSLLWATLITSVLFALGHLQFGSGAPLLWVAALDTFTLSLFLIYLRQKTDSLAASMLLHALKNTVAFLTIFIFHLS